VGGCTNCGEKVGCDDRKGSMMGTVEQALADVYPTRTWGEPDDAHDHAMPPDELAALADELAQELTAATFVELGGDFEPCDYIWVLCMGRAPCILQVRDFGVPVPAEWDATVDELYLRVCISHRAHVAGVQQVAVRARRDETGGYLVDTCPRAGVYDAPLLHRMQKLVAILPTYDLLHVDFGEIAAPPQGFHAGAWTALYGAEPAIANYLFYPQPTTMIATAAIPAAPR
jgi:hypothetical protein